jgi:hypothetical protein
MKITALHLQLADDKWGWILNESKNSFVHENGVLRSKDVASVGIYQKLKPFSKFL